VLTHRCLPSAEAAQKLPSDGSGAGAEHPDVETPSEKAMMAPQRDFAFLILFSSPKLSIGKRGRFQEPRNVPGRVIWVLCRRGSGPLVNTRGSKPCVGAGMRSRI
jgi:hypothetical protein